MPAQLPVPENFFKLKAKLLPALFCCFFLLGCHEKHHTVTRGFYFWKTSFELSDYEQNRLAQAQSNRIYLRCFDVDWDAATDAPKPIATLRVKSKAKAAFSYVPVVFITQPAIIQLRTNQLAALAQNIDHLLAQLCTDNGLAPKEIQIDCDWTGSTRNAYFQLLELLKRQAFFKGKKLSCTIRLHQVKYRLRSGIPLVDRGLIMCYNVGNLKRAGAHNSILDPALVKNYLAHLESYPLPVDIALPLYNWCLHFREGKMKGILRDITPESVQANSLFIPQKNNLYRCAKDTVWQAYSFRAGDEIRVEKPSLADIETVAKFTAGKVRNDSLSVLLFHLDSLTLSKYTPHDLEAIYHAYH